MAKDRLFCDEIQKQFEFDESVASVFDDMISRSVPFYDEMLKLGVYFMVVNTKKNTNKTIYDLGSSSGNFLLSLSEQLPSVKLIGIDNAQAMINISTQKAKAYKKNIEFICANFLDFDFASSCGYVANFTLQFIRPQKRESFVRRLYESLEVGGIFILSEKVISKDKILDKQFIDKYLAFKRENGYSQNEIDKKRLALENVLVPFSLDENIEMLTNAGFSSVEVVFKWVNFVMMIARK